MRRAEHVNGHRETYYASDIGIWKMRSARFTSGSRLSFPRVAIYGRSIPANCQKTEKKFSRELKSLSERKVVRSRSIYIREYRREKFIEISNFTTPSFEETEKNVTHRNRKYVYGRNNNHGVRKM